MCKIQGGQNANALSEHTHWDLSSLNVIVMAVILSDFNMLEKSAVCLHIDRCCCLAEEP